MYCIKCGKRTQSETILCEVCQKRSGFRVKTKEDVEKNRKYGRYLILIGHIFVLIGLLSSFILIKMDAPKDYVAEIFEEKTLGVVEPEEETEQTDGEDEEEEEVLEEIGYSYSIMSYLTRKNVTEENTEDSNVLKRVADYVKNNDMVPLDLSDEETKKNLESQFGSESSRVMETLEYYDGVSAQGTFIIIIAIISMLVAVWLAVKNDFGWSMLFSLIATCPVWILIVKLNGITAWEYQSGMLFFIGGIFAALIGGMVGGNVDVCAECGTVLPGGSDYCFQCAKKIQIEKNKPDNDEKPESGKVKQEELSDKKKNIEEIKERNKAPQN